MRGSPSWYPMPIGYQDIFETTGFPSFSKTLAYSVQCQLNANWYEIKAAQKKIGRQGAAEEG